MHLGGADRGGGAAVRVAFEEADGVLPRRLVAEGVVHLRVDQAGDRGRAVGIDDDVVGLRRPRGRGADRGDLPASVRIESPLANGSRQSPVTMCPRLTIATFIVVRFRAGGKSGRKESWVPAPA